MNEIFAVALKSRDAISHLLGQARNFGIDKCMEFFELELRMLRKLRNMFFDIWMHVLLNWLDKLGSIFPKQ